MKKTLRWEWWFSIKNYFLFYLAHKIMGFILAFSHIFNVVLKSYFLLTPFPHMPSAHMPSAPSLPQTVPQHLMLKSSGGIAESQTSRLNLPHSWFSRSGMGPRKCFCDKFSWWPLLLLLVVWGFYFESHWHAACLAHPTFIAKIQIRSKRHSQTSSLKFSKAGFTNSCYSISSDQALSTRETQIKTCT